MLGIEPKVFAIALADLKDSRYRVDDAGLDVDDLGELVDHLPRRSCFSTPGVGWPQDPREQLDLAIRAVFELLAHAPGFVLTGSVSTSPRTSARL